MGNPHFHSSPILRVYHGSLGGYELSGADCTSGARPSGRLGGTRVTSALRRGDGQDKGGSAAFGGASIMKRFCSLPLLALGIATVSLFTGCVVLSVYPFYTAKDVSFDAELLGDWINPDEADQKWKFEKLGDKSYRVLFTEKKEKVSQIEATLFKLQDEWFLDFLGEMPEDSKFPPPIPSHMLFKIVQRSPELKFVFMNIEWLQKHLEKEPKALRHHMLKSGDKPEDKLPVLTAETEELQRFVVKHIKTADAWSEVITLKRAGK